MPALSSKEIADVISTTLKDQKSLSIILSLYSAWEKCRRTTVKALDWKEEYEKKRREGLLTNFNKWVQSSLTMKNENICNEVLSRVLAGLPNFLQF